jgi:putative nucleotidyltransferase with HDIG domain
MTVDQVLPPEERLKRRLGSVGNLPTPPVVFTQISKVMNDPTTSVRQVAAIMSEDPAMSAKVLRLSNSAYFGVRSEITHIRQAILVLGLDAIKALVLSSAVFDMFKDQRIDRQYQDIFWRHSLATALAARSLSRHKSFSSYADSEVAFSAGLLHDIGKLIICCFMPDEHKQIRQHVSDNNCSDYQAEEAVVGYCHNQVGSLLAETWKLPRLIRNAIVDHHFPQPPEEAGDHYASLVHVADYIARKTFMPESLKAEGWVPLQPEVAERYQLSDEDLESLSAQLLNDYTNSSTFLQMAMSA